MNKLIKQLIKERTVTLFLAVIIAFLGSYAYYVLPRQESPDVSFPAAMIITPYPGASPKDVKDLVTSKIEDELAELDGIDEIQGISNQGLSIIVPMFTANTDYDKAMQDVRNAVADAESELPNGAFVNEINTDIVSTAGIIISLSGENYSYEQLASFGELFKDGLTGIDGITKFEIEGEVDKEVKVDIDVGKLNQLGLSIEDVNNIIQSQNIEIPSGKIEYKSGEITVKTPGIYGNIEDIKNTIIFVARDTGVVTRLSDIANVYMDLEDGVEKYKQKGLNTVLLTGYFEKGKNVVIIGKDVRVALDKVKGQLPEDLIVEEIIYQPDDVAKSVNDFMINLVEGIVLVVIVVFLGMGLRNALVVSTAIPLSILMTFGVMYLMKIYIHQMSLTALIVALGILVDNAIVISDTIQVKIDEGESRLDAAYNGTAVSSIPIFTATLTTIAAFSPLLGMPGAAGKFLGSIPRVLIISIIAAYIVSMFITPAMSAIAFRPSKKKSDKEGTLRLFFKNTLKTGLKWKKSTIAVTFLALILVMNVLMPQLPSEFFPYADKDILYIEMNTEIGGSIDATEKLTDEVVELLSKEPEITNYTVSVGNGLPKYYITVPVATPSQDYGQMLCKFDLGDKKNRRFEDKVVFLNYIQNKLDANISGGKCSAKLLANAKPAEAKVILRLSSDNLDRLREVANLLKDEIGKIPGTTNVRHDMKDKTYELNVDVDEDIASNLGISKYDIQKQINVALYGSTSSVFRRDGNEYNIKVKGDIHSVEELENLGIKSSMTNNKIPLKQFAKVTYSKKDDTIKTFNREQTVELLANELPGYSPATIEDIIEFELLPTLDTSGVKIDFAGEREDISENFGIVGLLAVFAMFIIYVILVIQFKSFMQPLVIMITIPLSLIGSVTGLFIFNKPLSLTAFLGIIALIGLVVKNGILLIEYINDARKRGDSIDDACIDAVGKRFNAIILSATTTVIGLVPLALSGSGLFGPMAISLMFGLMASTFLTMIVIPVVYSLVEGFMEKMKNRRKAVAQ
ncbi:efflux RND transporter permease subunit [Anaeromicrobium sediminis]|uniref:efflux RND transporter permease subunit n=1 Tax=Anaeromicrobium sediminis TaxID=1478221 RepID=UPI001595BF09|nr:efflux RND transporter permease subunit [Anaeromicrobium sediminis]